MRKGKKKIEEEKIIIDEMKGKEEEMIEENLGKNEEIEEGLGEFIGNIFKVWIGLKGGKGVEKYIGVLIGIEWEGEMVFEEEWIVKEIIKRY